MNPAEYDTMYRQENDHWWYRGLRAMIDQALEDSTPDHILDVGCGTGANASHLSSRGTVVATDRSPLALAKCRERGLTGLVLSSARELPFASASFELVTIMDVLQHAAVGPAEHALAEAARVLSPGGRLLMNVPAYEWLRAQHDEAVHTSKRFTRREVGNLLRAAGFELKLLTYWNSALLPLVVVNRKFRKRGQNGSDTERRYGRGIETAFSTALACERAIIRRVPLPFGVSVFASARKPAA